MPFLTLGFLVGTAVTKTTRRLFDRSWRDESVYDKNYLASAVSTDRPTGSRAAGDGPRPEPSRNPCDSVCRFSNSYKNCWMNAPLQAVLNLEVVQKKLTSLHPQQITSEFGVLFMTALGDPGRTFFPEDLDAALKELSEKLPQLKLSQSNYIHHFLEPLLMSLDRFKVKTSIEIKEFSRCERCPVEVCNTAEMNIYVLPPPGENDSITSLWLRSDIKNKPGHCKSCGFSVKKDVTVVLPEVLTLFVPRRVKNDSAASKSVSPCESLEFPQDGSTTLTYRLSSVVCVGDSHGDAVHAWTYLFKNRAVINANDSRVSVVESCGPDCVCHSGIYYFYERLASSSTSMQIDR